MENDLKFLEGEQWNSSRDVAEFTAVLDGKKTRCAISLEALCDNFDGDTKDPLKCFQDNRDEIQAIVAKLLKKQRFEKDGTILVRTGDL